MYVYVGNLPFDATEQELRHMFEPFGPIGSVILINDNISRGPLGFAFVEVLDDEGASVAVAHFDRTQMRDRTLLVSETEPRVERRSSTTTPCRAQAGCLSGII